MGEEQATGASKRADARPNAEAIEAWDTVLFDKFVRFRPLVTTGLGAHGSVAMDRLGSLSRQRVLDVGCGFGDTTQELARRVGPDGEVVGVDAARRFIEAAAHEAREAHVHNARFGVRDVQVDDLGGPFDAAFSRFGTMFFSNPVQAFKNIKSSIRENGRLCCVVWRKREDNPWLHAAELVVRKLIAIPEVHDASAGPTCGPGPFSMSGADLVSDQLLKAGYKKIGFERVELDILIGRTIDEAIEFALALGPAGEIIRLAGDEGVRRRPEIVAALRDALAPLTAKSGEVYGGSSTWVITASCS